MVGGVLAVIIRHQRPGGFRCDPGTGFGEVGGTGPPAAQGKFVRMELSPGIRPLQRHRRTDFLQNTQRPHCKLIQGDLAGLLGQTAGGRDGQDGFGIVLIGHRQLYQSLAHHRVREGADGTQSDGAFDIGMLGEQIGLMFGQAAVKNMTGGAVGVLGRLSGGRHERGRGNAQGVA